MKDLLNNLHQNFFDEISKCSKLNELNDLRIKYLGKKSKIVSILKQLGKLSKEDKREIGSLSNKIRNELLLAIKTKQQEIEDANLDLELNKEHVDISLPIKTIESGTKHPITLIMDEIEDVFTKIGFDMAEGPEIESVYRNFDALNTPKNHTSRDLTDTFYLEENETLLRCHTSTVQIKIMEKYPPPIRIISMGRCFRNDTPDATHGSTFYQVEGLCIDENISFSDLKGTLDYFVKTIFGKETLSRFRPHFFPFTEPSAEMDISCVACNGKGCSVCKNSGWLELGGAGMVNYKVLEKFNIDVKKYSGFAFGLGIERVAMLKYRINDLRLLYNNDIRFLKQFKDIV